MLRSRLYCQAEDRPLKIIFVTSASKGDGKTTIALNLAKVLADDGKRTLFIDADCYGADESVSLRARTPPPAFDVDTLTNWPAERFKRLRLDAVDVTGRPIRNLALAKAMFSYLQDYFDYIVVDCPPLPAISDTLVLGPAADLILSVVRLTHTKRKTLSVHNELLETLDVPRAMILNAVDRLGYWRSGKYAVVPISRLSVWLKKLCGQTLADGVK